MTKTETGQVLFFLKALYPTQFGKYSERDMQSMVDAWFVMLKDYKFADVMEGAKTFAATDQSGFCPSVGQVINRIVVTNPIHVLTAEEMWAKVYKAIISLHWESPQTDFDKLPETARKIVGSAAELKRMAYCDEKQLSNEKARFIRAYNDLIFRVGEYMKTPAAIAETRLLQIEANA